MTSAGWAVRGPVSRGALVLAVLVSLVVLFVPGDGVPGAPPGVDKLVHAGLFAALALCGRWAGARPRVLAAWLAGYGALSEVVQAVAPLERSGSVADWLADLAGLLLGLLVWSAAGARTSRRPSS